MGDNINSTPWDSLPWNSLAWHDFWDSWEKPLLSLIAILLLFGTRHLALRAIRQRSQFLSEAQRRWMSYIKNFTGLLLVIFLLVIWLPEVQEFALSITAITVALVIATKELILCFSGTFLKASTGSFSIGDWIEVNNVRGEVIDQNILATTIQEISPDNRYSYTGSTTTIPNSMFLSHQIKNLNFVKRYVFHSFTLTTEPEVRIADAEKLILQKIAQYSKDFSEVARRYNHLIEARAGIDIPGPEPRITLSTTESGKHMISLTLFCPTQEAYKLEQKLTRDFLEFLHQQKGWQKQSGSKAEQSAP